MTSPFVAGMKLRVSDLTGGTGSGSGGGAVGGGTVRMSADATTVSNSTSFTDTGLTLPVVANAFYVFTAWLRYTSGSTPDFKVQPSSPSGTTGGWSMVGYGRDVAPAADTGLGAQFIVADIGSSLTVAGDATGTLALCALINGSFTTTTAGNFLLRYGQRTATVSNTIARAGSFMTLQRLA
jgi:hypothetical protein